MYIISHITLCPRKNFLKNYVKNIKLNENANQKLKKVKEL